MNARLFITIAAAIFSMIVSSCAPRETVQVTPPPPPAPAKIAVVLGAGAARGFAHIGVLKILETNNIPVHMVVGTSAGSLVGSLYAYGYSAYQIQSMALMIERGDIIDLTVPDNGFIKGERLEAFMNKKFRNTPVEKFKIPFYAVATNIQNGEEAVFTQGSAGRAVRASCSIPGVFMPMKIGGSMYVDGGVVSPVAVDAARRYGADVVIAVDISADLDQTQPSGTIDTILQAVNIMYARLSERQIGRADVVIRPRVGQLGSSDFDRRHEAVLEGEKAAIEALPAIQGIIEKLRQEGRLN